MDFATMNPAEIDQAWLDATEPARNKLDAANVARNTAKRYAKYGYDKQAARYTEQADKLYKDGMALMDEIEAPFKAEWDRRGGWERAYIVPDGHIHKTTACHTLYITTLIAWLPQLSGHSEDEIVAHAGVHACTVCYPSAPVEALRAAAVAAKKAEQCPGSGEYAKNLKHWGQRYVACHHCGQSISVTSRGNLRAHKPKEAK